MDWLHALVDFSVLSFLLASNNLQCPIQLLLLPFDSNSESLSSSEVVFWKRFRTGSAFGDTTPVASKALRTLSWVKESLQAGQRSWKKSPLATGTRPRLRWRWLASSDE